MGKAWAESIRHFSRVTLGEDHARPKLPPHGQNSPGGRDRYSKAAKASDEGEKFRPSTVLSLIAVGEASAEGIAQRELEPSSGGEASAARPRLKLRGSFTGNLFRAAEALPHARPKPYHAAEALLNRRRLCTAEAPLGRTMRRKRGGGQSSSIPLRLSAGSFLRSWPKLPPTVMLMSHGRSFPRMAEASPDRPKVPSLPPLG
jgi:hypothetical protein